MRNMGAAAIVSFRLAIWLAAGAGLVACGAGEGEGEEMADGAGELASPEEGLARRGLAWIGEQPVEIGYAEIDGEAIFEGDIVLDPGILQLIEDAPGEGLGRAAQPLSAWPERLWPAGEIPYVVDADLPLAGRVADAIAHLHAETPLRLVPREDQSDYVRFMDGDGCASYVGRIGGAQGIEIAAGCSVGSVVHEILHAAGAWHEQARRDRDGHVRVLWENVEPGKEHNFATYDTWGIEGVDLGEYDLKSIMHYGSYAFSKNGGPTLVRKDGGGTFKGQRKGLSPGDVAGLEALYSPPEPPAPACEPLTCEAQGFTCGRIDDGCGAEIECGRCGSGEACLRNRCSTVVRGPGWPPSTLRKLLPR